MLTPPVHTHTPATVVQLQKLLVLNPVFGVCFEAQACGDENVFSDDLLRGISPLSHVMLGRGEVAC